MATRPPRSPVIAVDTNLPLDLADRKESALGCAILLTGDAHLRGLDFQRTSLELKAFDVEMPIIATPREIVAKFF